MVGGQERGTTGRGLLARARWPMDPSEPLGWRRVWRTLSPVKPALGLVAVLAAAGCSAPVTFLGQVQPAECLSFAASRAQEILAGSGMTVDKAAAVKSVEHKQAYYVAIRFHGAGVDDETGVWATNDLGSGSVFSVDGFAKEFSDFPKMDGFSSTDPGAAAAKVCVA